MIVIALAPSGARMKSYLFFVVAMSAPQISTLYNKNSRFFNRLFPVFREIVKTLQFTAWAPEKIGYY
ncbi:hypothetical protein LJC32_05320 [Oscillospiraceae bacterium OttesenSCG-928-F05]|nr:hypothetical protein [Oscillospiraceae bacterium OttesenSCG-928-F05]